VTAGEERERRALRRLSVAGMVARPEPGDEGAYAVFPEGDRRRRAVARLDKAAVARLLSAGALERSGDGEGVVLTAAGRALVKRGEHGAEGFRAQHMDLAAAPAHAGEASGRAVNLAESPLGWLARRTDGRGAPLISTRELLAGERLRADFHTGRYIGRVTSDWSAPPRGSTARGPSDAQLAPTERAVAARARVAAALAHVGAGLDRVVSAVCLEGRGLDDVERGYGWPRRSAKIVLRIALGRLADHYGLPAERRARGD
jgi:hypothetical protein